MTSRTLQKPRNRVREIEGRWTRGETRRATASACSSVHWAKRREVGLGFKEIWPASQISLMQATRTEFCQSRARRSWGSRRTQRSRHLRPLCRLPPPPMSTNSIVWRVRPSGSSEAASGSRVFGLDASGAPALWWRGGRAWRHNKTTVWNKKPTRPPKLANIFWCVRRDWNA